MLLLSELHNYVQISFVTFQLLEKYSYLLVIVLFQVASLTTACIMLQL
jgi:hypothetical protein